MTSTCQPQVRFDRPEQKLANHRNGDDRNDQYGKSRVDGNISADDRERRAAHVGERKINSPLGSFFVFVDMPCEKTHKSRIRRCRQESLDELRYVELKGR